MKIKNLTGYMLTNNGAKLDLGDKWWPYDTTVWICQTPDLARQIMHASQTGGKLEPNPVWNTIYQVFAPEIDVYKIDGGMIYTTQATKIFAVKPIAHYTRPELTPEQYLARAAKIMPYFSRLMR